MFSLFLTTEGTDVKNTINEVINATQSNDNLNISNFSIGISFIDGLFILFLSLVLGLFLRFVFKKYSTTYSSKNNFGNTILLVTISVASLIAVVKSSLALSLGLVGALSVVRFRTAVKEPYNLAFILLAICTGISIGASQYLFAFMIGILGSLISIFLYKQESRNLNSQKNYIDLDSITISLPKDSNIDEVYKLFSKYSNYYLVSSFSQSNDGPIYMNLKINIDDQKSLSILFSNFKKQFPNSDINIFSSPNS